MEQSNIDAFNPKKAELAELVNELEFARSIVIVDKKTYNQVHESHMKLRKSRVSIEKIGKSLREDANKYLKQVIQAEKDLIGILTPLETSLKEKKNAYEEEKKRKKEEEEKRKREIVVNRTLRLAKYGELYEEAKHSQKIMSDAVFDGMILRLEIEYQEQEEKRKSLEEEQEKLKKEQEELAQEKKRIEQEKEDAENARIAKEKQEQEKREALEREEKYREFCGSIGLTSENVHEFTHVDTPEGRKFYKFVGVYR